MTDSERIEELETKLAEAEDDLRVIKRYLFGSGGGGGPGDPSAPDPSPGGIIRDFDKVKDVVDDHGREIEKHRKDIDDIFTALGAQKPGERERELEPG